MSRIPLTSIEQLPEPIRQFVARRGNLNVFRLLANVPHVFVGWTQMVDELFDSPTFSLRMREVSSCGWLICRAHATSSPST
jgi:4-carboxymuconolactone decarboxylase